MKRILFVYSDRFCSCTRKRTFEVAQAIYQYKQKQIKPEIIFYKNIDNNTFDNYDVIVLQRLGVNRGVFIQEEKELLLNRIRKRQKSGGVFIYDIDDFLFERQEGFPIQLMQVADLALAPNEGMQKLMRAYQKNCALIRTHIDLESHDRIPVKRIGKEDVVKIGWFSNQAYGIDLIKEVTPILKEKYQKRAQVYCFVTEPFYSSLCTGLTDNIKLHLNVGLSDMYAILKGFDILINPVAINKDLCEFLNIEFSAKNKFADAKSEIKYAHAGAAKIPIISYPSSAYRYAIKHGENGLLATSIKEWIEALDYLITKPEERVKMGSKARQDVEDHYSYSHVADCYERLINEVV